MEELESNAWVKIFSKIHQYNPGRAKISTFLITLTKNATTDYLRGHDPLLPHNDSNLITFEYIYKQDEDENKKINKDDIKKVLFTLDEIIDEYEKFVSLEKYMKKLTLLEKTVMILKIKNKASFEEIGFYLNITVASARSAYNRSKKKLLTNIGKQEFEELL